jgi:hypothetical protein
MFDASGQRWSPKSGTFSAVSAYEGLEETRHAIRVLKPHGSVGWRLDNGDVVRSASVSDAVVVAPTHLKFVKTADHDGVALQGYLDQAPALTTIWTALEKQMRAAKALVFVGYSFPIADLYFSSLLRTVLAERGRAPQVIIVNPDAVAIAARFENRFAVEGVVRLFDFQQLVGMKRKDILKLGTEV